MKNSALCPKFEAAFELLGKRWTGLIIHVMLNGPKRFSDFQEVIPNLSPRMLTERLKELEEHGVVLRQVYPEMPVRIEYELTDKGRDLQNVMTEVQAWASKWSKE